MHYIRTFLTSCDLFLYAKVLTSNKCRVNWLYLFSFVVTVCLAMDNGTSGDPVKEKLFTLFEGNSVGMCADYVRM